MKKSKTWMDEGVPKYLLKNWDEPRRWLFIAAGAGIAYVFLFIL